MLLVLLAAGCTLPEPVQEVVPLGAAGHALVLSGWEYDWEQLSHRVSLLRVDLHQDRTLDLGLIGGSFTTGDEGSDTPHYRVSYAEIAVPGAVYTEASASWTIGPEPAGSATLAASAPEGCDDRVVALLAGFSIDTDVPQSADYPADYDPALGYTSNGFGFALGEPSAVDGELTVDVTATVRWAAQDREDMNAAIPYAQTGVSASALFVCFTGDIATATAAGETDYPWDPPYTEQGPMEADLAVEGGERDGVVGSTGFDLVADFTNVDGSPAGDYLRSFGVEASGEDDGDGTWNGSVQAQITNSSLIEYGDLLSSFSADYTRIGVSGAVTVVGAVEGTHDVGEATLTLD